MRRGVKLSCLRMMSYKIYEDLSKSTYAWFDGDFDSVDILTLPLALVSVVCSE